MQSADRHELQRDKKAAETHTNSNSQPIPQYVSVNIAPYVATAGQPDTSGEDNQGSICNSSITESVFSDFSWSISSRRMTGAADDEELNDTMTKEDLLRMLREKNKQISMLNGQNKRQAPPQGNNGCDRSPKQQKLTVQDITEIDRLPKANKPSGVKAANAEKSVQKGMFRFFKYITLKEIEKNSVADSVKNNVMVTDDDERRRWHRFFQLTIRKVVTNGRNQSIKNLKAAFLRNADPGELTLAETTQKQGLKML